MGRRIKDGVQYFCTIYNKHAVSATMSDNGFGDYVSGIGVRRSKE